MAAFIFWTIEALEDFIKNSCTQTTYPKLCFDTLSTYANTIQTRPEILAQAALNVTLDSARTVSAAVSGAGGGRLMSPREAAAISDCVESVGDSVDELRQLVAEMEGPVGQDFYVKVGDVQTWVSAALTEEDTCMDGLDEGGFVGGEEKVVVVRERVLRLARLTSNALALVNGPAPVQAYKGP
ncbi:hypothetical protein QJS10_CPB11g00428 [Acorus calamus]|uniref:Pectinesterase inhibitor domain-containing protein n=1 Tax=Acorus calamus TaxID=4465 RepID=A0AAV9DXV6_ACOCL|nr:hypothetical protein QJS10_CPB11g00428 [Acorus calamus]